MAYLTLHNNGIEFDRRPLAAAPAAVGRGADCELSVHDILLSRRHFRLTPTTDGWLLIDLASRNGTVVNGKKVEQQILKDRDVIRAGKTLFRFRDGVMPSASRRPALPPAPAAGPSESTAVGLVVPRPPEIKPTVTKTPPRKTASPAAPAFRMASPKPRPRDPDSFADTGVYALLDQIVSSSWDSTYTLNARPLPRAAMTTAVDRAHPVVTGERVSVETFSVDLRPLPTATVIRPGVAQTAARFPRLRRFVRGLVSWHGLPARGPGRRKLEARQV